MTRNDDRHPLTSSTRWLFAPLVHAILATAVLVPPASAQANPSFEINTLTAAPLCSNGSNQALLGPGQAVLADWEILAGGTVDLTGSGAMQPSDGGFSIDLDGVGPGGIRQTLSWAIPGASYSVTFDLAGNPVWPPVVKQMRVSVGAEFADYTFDTASTGVCNMGWVSQSFTFTAPSTGPTVLTFSSIHNCGVGGAMIDNVQVSLLCLGTVGVPNVNDLTINGVGSGLGCSVPLAIAPGPQVTDFAVTSVPGGQVVGIISYGIACCDIPLCAPYSIDLGPGWDILYSMDPLLSSQWPGTPTNVINSAGRWELAVSHDLSNNVLRGVQFGVLSQSFACGVATTQAFDLTVDTLLACNPYGSPTNLTTDDTVAVNFAAFPSFSFYGVPYPTLNINSNGNVTFTAGDTNWSETESDFLSGLPRIAPLWTDWNPSWSASGPVTYNETASEWNVTWCNVPQYGQTTVYTFSATGHVGSGAISFAYPMLSPFEPISAITGLSPGASASLPNPVDLCPLGLNTGPLGQQAIYEVFNGTNSLDFLSASTEILFVPTGSGTYLQICN